MLHTATIIQGFIGSCGSREKFETRFEAEKRAEYLTQLGLLVVVETFDEQGQLIPMPSDSTKQLMRLLYPEPSAGFLDAFV